MKQLIGDGFFEAIDDLLIKVKAAMEDLTNFRVLILGNFCKNTTEGFKQFFVCHIVLLDKCSIGMESKGYFE